MIELLLLLAIGLAIALSGAIVFTAWKLTHPPRRTYASAVARGRAGDPGELTPALAFESWSFTSRGIELPVWDLPGANPDGPIVTLIHGWGDSRVGALVRLPTLHPLCSRIVALDLPGHGEAPGVCSLGAREVGDIKALLDATGDERPIVLMGWSLGAGLAIEIAAADERVAGVIAEAPYRLAPTPARNVLRAQRLPYKLNLAPAFWLLNIAFGGRLATTRFDRARHASEARCPLLVIHGEHDEICPPEDGREIAGAASHGEFALINDGDHNGLWTDDELREACEGAVQGFLASIA